MRAQYTDASATAGAETDEHLEFLISCPWSDYHPGVIALEALRKGNRRYLQNPFLDAYRLSRTGLGREIAERIYQDQTAERAPGKYKGPRFDFQRPCTIHLVQHAGLGSRPPGARVSYEKHVIGEVALPGGLSRQAICAEIADLFDRRSKPFPDLAFLPPEQWESGTGAPVYTSRGSPFYHIVQLTCNGRTLSGALVFVASSPRDRRPERFVTLHQGRAASGQLVQYLRRFRFLTSLSHTYVLDEGVQSLSEPIDLHAGRESGLLRYWTSLDAPSLTIRGDDASTQEERDLFLCRETVSLIQDAMSSAEAVEYASFYCSVCRCEFHMGEPRSALEEASERGEVVSVCDHCWYCPHCHRFSTPTERDGQFTLGHPCLHDRPVGEGLRRSSTLPEVPALAVRQGIISGRAAELESTISSLSTRAATGRATTSWPAQPAAISDEQIARMQLFASQAEQVRLKRDQAAKSLAVFWEQVERTPEGCWRWRGERSKTTLYHGDSVHSSTRRVEASRLSWVLGTGQLLPANSRELATCQTPDCINPAHKIEFVWLSDVWRWLCPGDRMGEDDWQEVAYRFKQRVVAGSVPMLQRREGDIAVRRAEFDKWLSEEGSQLIDEFSSKYQMARARAVSRAKDARPSQVGGKRSVGQGEAWWKRLGFSNAQAEKQVRLFQEMARYSGEEGTSLDQSAAQRNLERFYSRIALSQGDCWRWAWQEPMFRLYKYGPWVDPRELAWWLSTGTLYRGIQTRIASHNGRSWCLNPTHSDVEFTTVSAALFLPKIAVPQRPEVLDDPHPLDDQVQELRHRIHQAIEHRELPYRLDERTLGLKLWRSDVLAWWKTQ